MGEILGNIAKAIGGGFCLFFLQRTLKTDYLSEFLRENLVMILVGLLAINSATLGVVLTKIRDLIDEVPEVSFARTRGQMVLSIWEQVFLIGISLVMLMAERSPHFSDSDSAHLFFGILIPSCLVFGLMILFDTTKSIFVILDFPKKKD